MDKPRVRLIDVAARAGVSRTVASVALRGKGRVSDQTRAKVQRVAAELGYIANPVAQNLRRRQTGAIGLYLPVEVTGHAYYMDFAFGVVDAAQRRGISVLLVTPKRNKELYGSDSVDGYVIIDAVDDDPFVEELLKGSTPVVSGELSPSSMPPPAGVVAVDHIAATIELLDHLVAQGSKRPALIVPPPTSAWARQVRTAYDAWCRQHGVEPDITNAPFVSTADTIKDAAERVLSSANYPDAIICAPDGACLGVLAIVVQHGLVPGEGILIASYVDSAPMKMFTPSITAIDLHPRDHGSKCAEILLSILGGEGQTAFEPPVASFQETNLRIRESTTGRLPVDTRTRRPI
ncbi:LacI family DNA-binding transcriptional regulator [Arthrobacter sp. KNU-44]|uniref:LacI family DNA-binding transcriptional regulator n=1 Tax=Arthrobacter sp. KNU-44 TaxID=3450744 RepID=UPI003F43AFC0